MMARNNGLNEAREYMIPQNDTTDEADIFSPKLHWCFYIELVYKVAPLDQQLDVWITSVHWGLPDQTRATSRSLVLPRTKILPPKAANFLIYFRSF